MTRLKGIALSGGAGTRLYRWLGGQQAAAAGLQQAVVYYPLTTLMLAGCRDILIVNPSRPYCRLFGDGKEWGIDIGAAGAVEPHGVLAQIASARPARRRREHPGAQKSAQDCDR
jgi:glucose-1-phosphate thymidylyltransferase